MQRGIVACLLLVCCACAHEGPAGEFRVVDLTHAFDAETIYWPTEEGFHHEPRVVGRMERGFWYEAFTFRAPEHGGTHIDAPVHFWEGGTTVDRIPVDRLVGPGVVVDVTRACAADRDHLVSVAALEAHEREHGRIPQGAIVLLHTGFGRFWPDRARYMGTDARGEAAVAELHFPGLHPDAADWLVDRRAIRAVGLDTPSIDHGPSVDFESHVRLFSRDVPAFENVTDLDRLPATGFTVVALPMKIRDGSGGPLRIIALLDSSGG